MRLMLCGFALFVRIARGGKTTENHAEDRLNAPGGEKTKAQLALGLKSCSKRGID